MHVVYVCKICEVGILNCSNGLLLKIKSLSPNETSSYLMYVQVKLLQKHFLDSWENAQMG